jgi:hypothetical protein
MNQWVCVELLLDPPSTASPAGRVRLLFNGNLILDVPPADFIAPLQLGVGLLHSPAGQMPRIYVDDVALANSRIGCE